MDRSRRIRRFRSLSARPTGFDLYNGAPGLALFLAAHGSIKRCVASSQLAVAAVSGLRENLKGAGAARFARSLGLGGGAGIGSIVYALTVLGSLLRDQELHDDAVIAARLVTDELIAADRALDVMGGAAGCILGLLKLHGEAGDDDALALAIRCGEHLLRTRPNGGRGIWVGANIGPTALTGMAHGAAGFAYAFASLSAVTGRDDFAKVTRDCLDFENDHFSEEQGNWRDLRPAAARRSGQSPCRWCYGAGGIGLSRIGVLKKHSADAASLRIDIARAVESVKRTWPAPVDTLCCGNLWNIELLNESATHLNRPDLKQTALCRLTQILLKGRAVGDYAWSAGDKRFNLGLFLGIAGVGYSTLRQINRRLPNIPLWE